VFTIAFVLFWVVKVQLLTFLLHVEYVLSDGTGQTFLLHVEYVLSDGQLGKAGAGAEEVGK
jgi:hypothetical protein